MKQGCKLSPVTLFFVAFIVRIRSKPAEAVSKRNSQIDGVTPNQYIESIVSDSRASPFNSIKWLSMCNAVPSTLNFGKFSNSLGQEWCRPRQC
jgi:hypothetical protein